LRVQNSTSNDPNYNEDYYDNKITIENIRVNFNENYEIEMALPAVWNFMSLTLSSDCYDGRLKINYKSSLTKMGLFKLKLVFHNNYENKLMIENCFQVIGEAKVNSISNVTVYLILLGVL